MTSDADRRAIHHARIPAARSRRRSPGSVADDRASRSPSATRSTELRSGFMRTPRSTTIRCPALGHTTASCSTPQATTGLPELHLQSTAMSSFLNAQQHIERRRRGGGQLFVGETPHELCRRSSGPTTSNCRGATPSAQPSCCPTQGLAAGQRVDVEHTAHVVADTVAWTVLNRLRRVRNDADTSSAATSIRWPMSSRRASRCALNIRALRLERC